MLHFIRQRTSSQIIILGFAGVILLGSLLLMLPISTVNGKHTGFLDALFTATSAVCVTGLVVKDTATYWSTFGQTVILLLIQVGGMGIVTIALTISLLSGKRISLKQRSTMQEALSAPKVGGIVRLDSFIIRMTLLIEGIGVLVLAPVFIKEHGIGRGIWYGVFHSVSAFCNAGFDLMGVKEPFSSLTHYAVQPAVNLCIMALIIIGGIGFLTWDDIRINRHHLRKYRMQSKVILSTTALLLLLPAVYFFFFEFHDRSIRERIWLSVFQTVTPRTAGFNTADLTTLSENGLAVIILLMMIGGAPGSTAGGMKVTTLAVLFSTALSVFRKREHTHFYGRRVAQEAVRNAMAVLMMYLCVWLLGGFLISALEELPLLHCLFETASAVGTVGLTLGITPELGWLSRVILIVLMYFGRVGGLTLVFAALAGHQGNTAKLPEEKMTVG